MILSHINKSMVKGFNIIVACALSFKDGIDSIKMIFHVF